MSTFTAPTANERAIAPLILLVLGKFTRWNYPIGGGGDPYYFTPEQTESLAGEGVRLLAGYLPKEAAQQVINAIARIPSPPPANTEEVLLHMGKLGVETVTHKAGGPPSCCVGHQGGLICVHVPRADN